MSGQQQEQAQQQAAFEQAFASASGQPSNTPPASAAPAVAEEVQVANTEAKGTAPAEVAKEVPQSATAETTADQGNVTGATQGNAATTAEEDPEVFEGFKRSELRRLLDSAAEVESVKRQLDKANGKIGELNRRVQQQAAAPAPTAAPAPAVAPELPPELQQIESDYPEVAAYVKHVLAAQQPRQVAPPTESRQPAAAGAEAAVQAGPDSMAIELAVMDRMHKGWREKLASQDFNLWLASQQAETQQAFHAADTADGLAAVIGQYDKWSVARTAATDKAAKGQQRLRAATTPSGNAPRPQAAPTEQDAFVAGFKSVMAR